MANYLGRLVFSVLPLVLLAIAFYIVFKLVFVGRPPKFKPSLESHDHLRE